MLAGTPRARFGVEEQFAAGPGRAVYAGATTGATGTCAVWIGQPHGSAFPGRGGGSVFGPPGFLIPVDVGSRTQCFVCDDCHGFIVPGDSRVSLPVVSSEQAARVIPGYDRANAAYWTVVAAHPLSCPEFAHLGLPGSGG